MNENQKRLVAVALCIIGIVGTLMAVKDSGGNGAPAAVNERLTEVSTPA